MTATVVRTDYVTVPSRTVKGSILDIAEVHEGLPWDGTGLIESFNCIGVDVDAVTCAGFKGLTKRFDPPSWSDGHQFNLQCGVTCKPFGFNGDDPALTAAFQAMEPEGVSIGVHDTVLVNATDVTPATGPVTPLQGLGLLESAGYGAYAGLPVIWAGPMQVSQFTGLQVLTEVGGHLETRLGTPVAVSAGVETKTAGKLDANQWMFVTGHVVLWRSEVQQASAVDQTTNQVTALYERLYSVAVDCFSAKVSVKVL
jgi:hypothetical protein